ncbi:hypothetical protein C0989_002043, partial [Termitomyces sp. Mn162]
MVLSDPCHSGALVKELELEGLVEVVAPEVKLTADEGARGTAVDKGGEDLGQAIESDIDDKQPCRPQAELRGSSGLVNHGLGVLRGG